MRIAMTIAGAITVALGGCDQQQGQEMPANSDAPPAPVPPAAPQAPTAPAPPAAPRPPSPPLAEQRGPIDPKSAEAAGQIVQHYGALIEQDRWQEANRLWGDAGAASKFQAELRRYSDVHVEIGKPGDMEGAAGSIYLTEPVVFYGKLKAGGDFRRSAEVILRRVNDVPGSTEAQRRWHIERIDWGAAG